MKFKFFYSFIMEDQTMTKKHTTSRTTINIKNEKTSEELTLQVKKGNSKPIAADTYIISMTSSLNCVCSNICPYHHAAPGKYAGSCYGLGYELNPVMTKNTLTRRNKDTAALTYIIEEMKNGAQFLANELIKISNRSRKPENKIKFLRWNETGDIKNLTWFMFIDNVSDILYKELGVVSVIYTHRRDLWEEFKTCRKSPALIVLGSGFQADINFIAEAPGEPIKGDALDCCGDCINCSTKDPDNIPYCYNLNNKGKVIKEPLRNINRPVNREALKEALKCYSLF